MRYFLLSQDERFTDVPRVKSWPDNFDPRDIARGRSRKLPRRVLMEIYPNAHTVFGDIVVRPFLLLSDRAREAVSVYETRMPYKQVVLLDRKNELVELYFLPILETVDCLSPESEMNSGRTVFRRAVLDGPKLPGHSIFKLAKVSATHVVIRLDLAESLLRRGARGITLAEVEVRF